MHFLSTPLFPYERTALIEALRRDERREAEGARTNPEWEHWHKQNARLSRRLLDLLEPYEGLEQCVSIGCLSYATRRETVKQDYADMIAGSPLGSKEWTCNATDVDNSERVHFWPTAEAQVISPTDR